MSQQSRKERLIEADNVRYAETLGVRSIKMNTLYNNGWPDRLYLIPGGQPFWVEYKELGEKPSKLQLERIQHLKEKGYDVEVIDDKEEGAHAIFQRVCKSAFKLRAK